MYLAAAVVTEPVIIEQTLYWAAATDLQEARYLEAIVNSDVMTQMLRPMQARGEHNPRHYAKDLWQVPVPVFDPMNEAHVRLSNLAEAAETIAAKVALPAKKRFEVLRRMVREAIAAEDVGKAIEREVGILLGGVVGVSRR
jgi:tetrahydromethanopterin S-methyltransferase subunit G